MGIDFHGLNFLRYAAEKAPFGETVTIGRQELHVNPIALEQLMPGEAAQQPSAYCDSLLMRRFGASKVDSIDNCDYEAATHVLDMGQPLDPALHERFDTLIDAGTLEHIFNINQALDNCSRLVRPGGRIIHILPANNYCGHGFWQFSPELFYSLYAEKNGYRDTKVFLSDYVDRWSWYEVLPPQDGKRVNVSSATELYAMVVTQRAGGDFRQDDVQQSDYLHEWDVRREEPTPAPAPAGVKGAVMRSPLYDRLFPLVHRGMRLFSSEKMSPRNPGLRRFDVRSLRA
ncbi:methyltransferase domain-containing protein [Novosphingobium terrae]|uniref:methyltransferase domain-containing protein n=1 Tax=Novosphingobium terrae TaxID=2726189 RepID=UPI0019815F17|nr:class I SAM-dependent methyltransferase [Novosphingobium terrae]